MAKRITMAQRREQFFETLERVRVHADKAAYLQGCRAANPSKHDTAEVRERENRHSISAYSEISNAVTQFNAAVRAAGREP